PAVITEEPNGFRLEPPLRPLARKFIVLQRLKCERGCPAHDPQEVPKLRVAYTRILPRDIGYLKQLSICIGRTGLRSLVGVVTTELQGPLTFDRDLQSCHVFESRAVLEFERSRPKCLRLLQE